MKTKMLGIFIPFLCSLGLTDAHANPWFDIDLDRVKPFKIDTYVDNSACLKSPSTPCATNLKRSEHTEIIFFGKYGGLHGLKNWGNTSINLIPIAELQNSEFIVNDKQGRKAYKVILGGTVEITDVYVATNINQPNFTWATCEGGEKSQSMKEALQGKPLRCHNRNMSEWLFGLKLKFDLNASIHRIGNGDVREITLPKDLKLKVHFDGTQQDGQPYVQDKEAVWFEGGNIKLNDRKCYINLSQLDVDFGEMSMSPTNKLIREVPTSIPVYCSGYSLSDQNQTFINGVGVKDTINGISVKATSIVDGDSKKIAVPNQSNLFVEVGGQQAGQCGATSSIEANGIEQVKDIQQLAEAWDHPGRTDGRPITLYWRLCQKQIGVMLKDGEFEKTPAATLRLHYN